MSDGVTFDSTTMRQVAIFITEISLPSVAQQDSPFASDMYTELVSVSVLGVSSYGLYLASSAGLLLNSYRPNAERAAKISSTAASQLADTQKTVGVALLTTVFSIFSLGFVRYRDGWAAYAGLFNTLLATLSYRMILGYWKDNKPSKTMEKVPGVGDYSAAWRKMQTLQNVLLALGGGWCFLTMLGSPHSWSA